MNRKCVFGAYLLSDSPKPRMRGFDSAFTIFKGVKDPCECVTEGCLVPAAAKLLRFLRRFGNLDPGGLVLFVTWVVLVLDAQTHTDPAHMPTRDNLIGGGALVGDLRVEGATKKLKCERSMRISGNAKYAHRDMTQDGMAHVRDQTVDGSKGPSHSCRERPTSVWAYVNSSTLQDYTYA